jgi:hypothetical protein
MAAAPQQQRQQGSAVTTAESEASRARALELDRSIAFGETGVEITNLEQAGRFAAWAVESGLVKTKNRAEVVIALQIGVELGFSPMQALQVVHVIDGKPSVSVEAQAAKVESDGAIEPGTKIMFRYEGEGEKRTCIVWSHPKGGEMIESPPVQMSDFKHLRDKANWKNYPDRMLKARAVGFHIRDFYARSVRNLPTSEEMVEVREMRGEPPVPREREINPPAGPDPLLSQAQRAFNASEKGQAIAARRDAALGRAQDPTDAEIVEPAGDPPGCAHPEGFAEKEGVDGRVCIDCGMHEDDADEPVQQELA